VVETCLLAHCGALMNDETLWDDHPVPLSHHVFQLPLADVTQVPLIVAVMLDCTQLTVRPTMSYQVTRKWCVSVRAAVCVVLAGVPDRLARDATPALDDPDGSAPAKLCGVPISTTVVQFEKSVETWRASTGGAPFCRVSFGNANRQLPVPVGYPRIVVRVTSDSFPGVVKPTTSGLAAASELTGAAAPLPATATAAQLASNEQTAKRVLDLMLPSSLLTGTKGRS
jgi:hypothetical protein